MRILVIDAHGGGVGKLLVSALRKALPQAELLAVGTNTTATEAMHKAGATAAATGENAVASRRMSFCSRSASISIFSLF